MISDETELVLRQLKEDVERALKGSDRAQSGPEPVYGSPTRLDRLYDRYEALFADLAFYEQGLMMGESLVPKYSPWQAAAGGANVADWLEHAAEQLGAVTNLLDARQRLYRPAGRMVDEKEAAESLAVWGNASAAQAVERASLPAPDPSSRRVFVVHGRDRTLRAEVSDLLRQLRLEPVIMDGEVAGGRTLIEKLEATTDVSYAVVLLTPDDEGRLAGSKDSVHGRARQNVVFELGYLMGRIGRTHVATLLVEGVEQPSDYHGLEFIQVDAAGAWRTKLARELRAAGLPVSLDSL